MSGWGFLIAMGIGIGVMMVEEAIYRFLYGRDEDENRR